MPGRGRERATREAFLRMGAVGVVATTPTLRQPQRDDPPTPSVQWRAAPPPPTLGVEGLASASGVAPTQAQPADECRTSARLSVRSALSRRTASAGALGGARAGSRGRRARVHQGGFACLASTPSRYARNACGGACQSEPILYYRPVVRTLEQHSDEEKRRAELLRSRCCSAWCACSMIIVILASVMAAVQVAGC